MFFRALIAFLILPGVYAGLIPAVITASDPHRGGGSPLGYPFVLLGFILLLWCVRDFYVSGNGTLAPWDPPKRLVVSGLYRFVRNPMYVAMLILLAGWTVAAGSRWLGWYTAFFAVAFHLRIVLHEEPLLRRQFGAEWLSYAAAVRRWLPRARPWKQEEQ
jgi:protein-S-isoprenylcysteine O-methyltransferase Ste14